MHATIRGWLMMILFAGLSAPLAVQAQVAPPPQPAPPAGNVPVDPLAPAEEEEEEEMEGPTLVSRGLPLPPEGEAIIINNNTIERFTVAPYKLYDAPRSTREDVVAIEIDVPPADEGQPIKQLPSSFRVTTTELVGSSTIILPLVKAGEPPIERRVEVLVIDQVSQAYRSYLETTIKRLFPTVSVDVVVANSSTAILNGYVDRAELVDPIVQLVRGFLAARTGGAPDSVTVVNAVRVIGAQQVQLKVVLAEVNRSRLRELGFSWQWFGLGPNLGNYIGAASGVTTGASIQQGILTTAATAQTPAVGALPSGTANVPFLATNNLASYAFLGFLRALETNVLGKILAEPTLVATSGQPSYFNVGGQVPILIPQGNATISIQYRDFGTNVRFVPTVLGNGRIRLQVRPEVTARNDANGIVLNGNIVPGFDQRVVETTVELENGQTFVLAGLIQRLITGNMSKIPVFGDLPFVGWSFRKKDYRQVEQELLVVVTPYLVDALDEGVCKLPAKESRVPNDFELYIGNKFEPPCFEDPYRVDAKPNFQHERVTPVPVQPYDNYGKPPEAYMPSGPSQRTTGVKPIPAAEVTAPAVPGSVAPGTAVPPPPADLKPAPAPAPVAPVPPARPVPAAEAVPKANPLPPAPPALPKAQPLPPAPPALPKAEPIPPVNAAPAEKPTTNAGAISEESVSEKSEAEMPVFIETPAPEALPAVPATVPAPQPMAVPEIAPAVQAIESPMPALPPPVARKATFREAAPIESAPAVRLATPVTPASNPNYDLEVSESALVPKSPVAAPSKPSAKIFSIRPKRSQPVQPVLWQTAEPGKPNVDGWDTNEESKK